MNLKKLIPLGLLFLLIDLLISYYFIVVKPQDNTFTVQEKNIINKFSVTKKSLIPFPSAKPEEITKEKIIVKVGAENIYLKDFDLELSYYNNQNYDLNQLRKLIIDKLVNDSVTLQSGYQMIPSVSLDKTVFNSLTKNYTKRINLVKTITEEINKQSQGDRSGIMISIWFNNLDAIPISREEAKKIAFTKITDIYNQVKNGSLTVEQAGQKIRGDSSLEQIDGGYEGNALFEFKAEKDKGITFDLDFDKIIWGLNEGELSDIYILKALEEETKEEIERCYAFAKVIKINNKNIVSLDKWLEKEKTNYEIQTF